MSIVSNTGPLIALAKVDKLNLLAALFGTVHIPPAVHRELLGKFGPEAGRLDAALSAWLTVAGRPEFLPGTEAALQVIDAGEREAIVLAQWMTLPLIVDDQLGRQAARSLAVMVTGTVGVVIEAKRNGLITAIQPVLEEMRAQGYWLSDELISLAAKLAGE